MPERLGNLIKFALLSQALREYLGVLEMVKSNGSAKKRGRPWGSRKDKGNQHHPHGGGRRRKRKMPTASRKSCMILVTKQTSARKIDAMSRRKYTIRRDAGLHLTDSHRKILATAWNQYVNRGARISLRQFARDHNVPFATWQREFRRGAVSPIIRRGNRWIYPEYDIDKARATLFPSSKHQQRSAYQKHHSARRFRYCTAANDHRPSVKVER